MTPKFTPGPWVIPVANVFRVLAFHRRDDDRDTQRREPAYCIFDPAFETHYGQTPLSWRDVDGAEIAANARLIAKAPAMYAELSRLREAVGEEDAKIIEQLLSEIDGED